MTEGSSELVSTLTTEYTGLGGGDKMNKFEVHISFIIAAETRSEVYGLTGQLIHKHMRDMANVDSVSRKPISHPEDWIAINEPIKAQE